MLIPRHPWTLLLPVILLLAGYGVIAQTQPPASDPTTQPTTGPTTQPATQPTTRPATEPADPADEVLERLLRERVGQGGPDEVPLSPAGLGGDIDEASGAGDDVVAPDTRPQRLVREGTYVVDRIGRVRQNREGDGLEFVFQADGTTPGSALDPPMLLIPNLNLMTVEAILREDPDRRFRVTGRVTEYRGRNYLMLEKVVMLR